jgi:hypothetical protein
MAAVALLTADGPVWTRIEDLWQATDLVIVLLTVVLLAWATGYAPGRVPRRRLCWLLVWSALTVGIVAVADSMLRPRGEAVVLTLSMWFLAGLVTRLTTAGDFRPVDEPLVEVLSAVLTLAIGAAVGVMVRLVGVRAGIPAPDLTAAFAAVTSTGLAWPAAAWWRRSWLTRRYGTGTLTSADVASITADLHHLSDPRELLAKAAEMVAASSGHPEVTLVLGEDGPDIPPGWVEHPLLVGGDRVGTLLLDPGDPEGPEPRQVRLVDQLVPTVALVCRAVALAVEADHARQDVARQRDAVRHEYAGPGGAAPLSRPVAGVTGRGAGRGKRRPPPARVRARPVGVARR